MNQPELRLAYEWTCDWCGRDQFIRSVRFDPSQLPHEELRELRNEHGVEPWEDGEWSMCPDLVLNPRICGDSWLLSDDAMSESCPDPFHS